MPHNKQSEPFHIAISALLDDSAQFPPILLHRFSDMDQNELAEFKQIWPKINPTRRAALLEDLKEIAENDTLVCFDDIGRSALTDNNPQVRTFAIHLLWECEDEKLAPVFIHMMENDNKPSVCAAAATALGLFIYLGELEKISFETHKIVEKSLIKMIHSQDDIPLLRRKAMESLGFSSHKEVPNIIQAAYDLDDKEWIASALFAMGRSADTRWEKAIINMLDHLVIDVQQEAICAAGQLELVSARQPLLNLLMNEEQINDDIRAAIIRALSQIGGENVHETLERLLEETEDQDKIDYIKVAIDNLKLTNGFQIYDMLDFNTQEKENLENIIDISEDQDEDGIIQ